jgi:hypothetical protein
MDIPQDITKKLWEILQAGGNSDRSPSGVNPIAAFYGIHGRKGKVLFLCSVSNTIQDFRNFMRV